MSKSNNKDQLIAGSRKEPIQHLPFFSSTDLDVGGQAAASMGTTTGGGKRDN